LPGTGLVSGTGKTSLMQLVKSKLADRDNIVTVWFNAWRYEQEEHPIVPLVGTIVRELERHKSFKQHMKDGGQALVRALPAIAYGFSAKSKVKVPGFAEIEASFVAKDMIERADKLTPDPLLDRSLYYQAFEALAQVDFGSEVRIVVLIDDLDRCFPDQAIRLLLKPRKSAGTLLWSLLAGQWFTPHQLQCGKADRRLPTSFGHDQRRGRRIIAAV
jgi:predicted KAP-like P-loop ATPase